MSSSCRLICVFALLINKASLQDTLEGGIGGSIVLQCFTSEENLDIQDIGALWRHNNTFNVCHIIQGKCSAEHQDSKYKNRAQSFPEEIEKGNFSLKLNNLTHTDAGKFQCYIKNSDKHVTVSLRINDSIKENKTGGGGNKAGETNLLWLWIVLSMFCVFLCISVCVYIYIGKGVIKLFQGACPALSRGQHQLPSNTKHI